MKSNTEFERKLIARDLSDSELLQEFCERYGLNYWPDSTGCILVADDCICSDAYGEPCTDGKWILLKEGITTGVRKGIR